MRGGGGQQSQLGVLTRMRGGGGQPPSQLASSPDFPSFLSLTVRKNGPGNKATSQLGVLTRMSGGR